VTGQLRGRGRDAHDLLEGEHVRTAELVGLSDGGAVGERAHEGARHVLDADGGEARVRPRERQPAAREPEQLREAPRERISRPEDHRGAKDRVVEKRGRAGHQHLGAPLGAQILAGGAFRIRAEGAHVQQAPHARDARLLDQLADELDVHVAKARAAALVEDADEIDRDIGAGEQLAEHTRLVNVDCEQLDGRQHGEMPAARE
jgi:hypothetical protein